jgi:hypothetical protein
MASFAVSNHAVAQINSRAAFGRMFLTLPAAQFDAGDLAAVMTAEFEAEAPETEVDDEENMGISADYTYLGQFIDHAESEFHSHKRVTFGKMGNSR